MRAAKRFVSLLMLLVASFGAAGCWDRTELNELAITSATAVDWEDGEWSVSYQVVIPSAISNAVSVTGGGASKLPIIVYSTQGKTIREAVGRSTLESPRHLFFSHTRVVVVSEAAARQGLSPLLDVYFRNPDSRETVSVLVAKGNARKILEQLMQIQIIPGDGIEETLRKEAEEFSALPNVRIYDLALSIVSPSKSAIVPEILISGGQEVSSADALSKTSLSSKLRLGRLAVFKNDRMAGWMTREEALGIAFIRDRIKTTTIPFSCGQGGKQKIDSAFKLTRSSTRLTPKKDGDGFTMKIEVEGEGQLLETDCTKELSEPSVARQLESQLELEITDMIETAWQAARKMNIDVVGFAEAIHRKYPKDWKRMKNNWPSGLAEIRIEPSVHITIKRMGLTNQSFRTLTEKD
ncbi:Ger(x)C family spore germination protein [Cohnella sp.]|uniref:Ger(x)C family spore germination protein n=1 Tax=Cohnella sp. TaxID=1883426 RepID=UPI003569873C